MTGERKLTMMRPRRSLLVVALAAITITIVILAAIPPLVTGPMVDGRVTFDRVWTGEEHGLTPQRLTLTTSDGIDVVAYEVRAEDPKAVVVFLSGIHNPSVTAFFGHSKMLLDEGYSSVLLEMRAHGESGGEVIALGHEEYRDVQAVVAYLVADSAYDDVPIVAFGLSMGAATAINAVGQTPEIDGLISLSAYSAFDDVFVDNMGAPEPLATVQRAFVRLYIAAKYGFENRNIVPKKEIRHLGDRPALIVHSAGDSQIPYANFERLVEHAPAHIETWVREGDHHFIVQDEQHLLDPRQDEEYAERIMRFLERHFGR